MPSRLEEDLARGLEGEVRFDRFTRQLYSVDASIYEIEPDGVFIPMTREALHQAVRIAARHGVPVIPRGAATGIAGGCIGRGLVIDTSKHLNRILEINYEEGYAICEPGVVQDQLNSVLSPRGYRLGPDTSTGNRATLGGMLANNSAGARSLRYGKMVDHILELELILSNGDRITLKALNDTAVDAKTALNTREGQIYREVLRIRDAYAEDIRGHFPRIDRRVSGYNLDELIKDEPLNLCKLIAGSEGSLGIVSKMRVPIVPKPRVTGLCILHFKHLIEALELVPELLSWMPLSLELIDSQIIKMGRVSPSMRDKLDWLQGDPEALLVVEFEGIERDGVRARLRELCTAVGERNSCYASSRILDSDSMQHVWALRKAGLGLLMSRRSYSRAIGFLEDVAVSPHVLAPFMKRFLDYLATKGKQAGVYGHVGAGCIHVRPFINLRKQDDLRLMEQMMLDISDLLLEYGGTLSGEHGDGLVRSWLNEKMFGPRLYQAFCELKHAFDPEGRMNPGKVVHAPPLLQDLRISPDTIQTELDTQFDFTRDGGFELAVDMCNGNGSCRKREGLMCPSYQAYGDEMHSTRARAQALRGIVNQRMPMEDFHSDELHEILDWCLECKGCKTQCPSQVDMAKIKAEFLYHYHEAKGASLRSKLFAYIPQLSAVASRVPRLANLLARSPLQRSLLGAIGVATERSLPPFATQRFSTWLKRHAKQEPSSQQVVLFNDTYTEFNHPEIGIAAYEILSALGYQVIVPPWTCCGRPMISKGFLPQAKQRAQSVVDVLYRYAKLGIPIIGLEPSCILTVKDDYRDLLSGNQRQHVVDNTLTLDQFLEKEIDAGNFRLSLTKKVAPVLLHGHCHQKSLVGMQSTLNVLRTLPGITVEEIPSGCCGLAGSFGYEEEHYDMSMVIAEQVLAPRIRKSPEHTLVVANGMSCRSQIMHSTGREAMHLAQIIASMLR